MAKFSEHCATTQALRSLESVTLTVSQHISDPTAWTHSALELLSHSPLQKFHIYSTYITIAWSLFGAEAELASIFPMGSAYQSLSSALATLWKDLVATHGQTLRRFSVLRMPISLASIREICAGCPNLEELFVVANSTSLDDLPDALSPAKELKTVHINFPVRTEPVFSVPGEDNEPESEPEDGVHQKGVGTRGTRTYLLPAEALDLVKRCSPSLTQFGCNTRVWKVSNSTSLFKYQNWFAE